MEDCCVVCAEPLEWVAYGSCGHREVCATCIIRLRFICEDRSCCICKSHSDHVFVTKALGDYTRRIADFDSAFGNDVAAEGKVGDFWYYAGAGAYFDDVKEYKMVKAMCNLSCSVCDKKDDQTKKRVGDEFRSVEKLKGHLLHRHNLSMCSLCLENRKVFISEQKLYDEEQLSQHVRTGDSVVDGNESDRGGFKGHPMCDFCQTPFYGDNEFFHHMSTEHFTCHICKRGMKQRNMESTCLVQSAVLHCRYRQASRLGAVVENDEVEVLATILVYPTINFVCPIKTL